MRVGLALATILLVSGAGALPGTGARYRIEVRLDPGTRAIAGREEIRWRNPASNPVDRVPLHLYLNAFAHDRTTWMLGNGGEWSDPAEVLAVYSDAYGFLEPSRVHQRAPGAGADLVFTAVQPEDGNPLDRTLLDVALATPVPPGGELVLEVEFAGRLPVPFARTGGVRDFFVAAQFYPKLGAFVDGSFRAHQFHAATEFFANFADYEVTIDVPPGVAVVATGRAAEIGGGRHTFRQRAVHDFVFAASPALEVESFVVEPAGGAPVEVRLAAQASAHALLPRARAAVTFALEYLSARVGPYPWDTLTVLLPPWPARRTAGMEYPAFVVGPAGDPLWTAPLVADVRYPESVLVHEVAHQWFQGALASDEVAAAYLDEGLATYAQMRMLEAMSPGASLGAFLGFPADDAARRRLELLRTPLREAIAGRPSFRWAPGTAAVQAYARTALTMRTAERLFGEAAVDRLLRDHFRAGAFAHPDLQDLLDAASLQAGGLLPFLHEAFERPDVPDYRVAAATSAPARGQSLAASWVAEVTGAAGGTTARRELVVARQGRGGGAHDVEVLLEGPDWRNLPVEVELAFEDGTVLRDLWDGRGTWRRYRLVAPAPLAVARVDAQGLVALDPDPANGARAVRASAAFTGDLAGWCAQLVAWVVAGGLP